MESEEKISYSYETLWKAIIRPPRDDYTEELLGDPIFTFNKKTYIRKDYTLLSSEGYRLYCSFIEPEPESRPSIEMPVVIYLHGNSSSRLEGLRMAPQLLRRDINLFVFDFAGCGLSEGEYLSLGYHEKDDIKIIIDFICNLPGVSNIGLWGRSMGAATTMIYGHKDSRVKAMVMDSPFAIFSDMAKDLTRRMIKLPNFIFSAAISIVGNTIKKKNGLDIKKLNPIDSAELTNTPCFFIHADKDELINKEHSKKLYEKVKGVKILMNCNGGHNSKRPREIVVKIAKFFNKYLRGIDEDDNSNGEEKLYIEIEPKYGSDSDSSDEENKYDPTEALSKELNEFSKNMNKDDKNNNSNEKEKLYIDENGSNDNNDDGETKNDSTGV